MNKTQLNTITNECVLFIDENLSIDILRETILNNINDTKNSPELNQLPHYNERKNYFPGTDSDLIDFQNQELKELEMQDEEHKIIEHQNKIESEKKVFKSLY